MADASRTETWTTRTLLDWMTRRFTDEDFDVPRVVAEMLAAHVFKCERIRLYMDVDRPASAEELAELRGLVRRALDREPVQYLVGTVNFLARSFAVNSSTLIPQPCTEELVEHVIQWIRDHVPEPADDEQKRDLRLADIGCGCGCIALSLAGAFPDAKVVATDVVPEAVELTMRNAARLPVGWNLTPLEGSLLDPLRESAHVHRYDVICSNPPYIPDSEWTGGLVDPSVKKHVPESALRGGPDGLDFLRPLIAEAPDFLKPGGLLALEHSDSHHEQVLALAKANALLTDARIIKDHDGYCRFLLAERKAG